MASSCKCPIDISFSCVCPVIDREFRHNIVKVAVDPRGDSRVDPQTTIARNGKYHNSLSLSTQILNKHCFQFLLGLTMVPRANKNNAYSKFG